MRGTYTGSIKELRGQKALLQEKPGSDNVMAQFDDFDARRNGVDLSHGWHLFRRADFYVNPTIDDPEIEMPGYVQSALNMNKR